MNKDLNKLVIEAEKLLENEFQNVDKIALINSEKVLNAFHNNHVSEIHFHGTTGYGYNDLGRDTIDNVYKDIFKTESAIVRTQFISGTHALTVALFAMLRPNDILLSISGKPYDTLDSVIGFNDNPSSLKSYNIKYAQIDLINDDFDYESIEKLLKKKNIKLIEIQRSKGYSTRKSLSIKKLEKVIKLIKKISPKTIIMVDNCYCEFVSTIEPSEIGADLTIGSLIKNLGGGITPNGAYIVGKKDLIELCSERLSVPGEGKDVGPTMNNNRLILQGLYLAPSVVKNSLKVAILTSYLLEKLGFNVEPKYNEERVDIVQNIIFNNKDLLIKYVEGIQSGSAIDSNAIPIPDAMPGYDDLVIMASGSFIQGSSIELSCDGPLRKPYIAYQQGSLTYEYGKLGIIKAISKII
jgi:cystathionine beta-lyase family protein involved in aluminum resistance